MSENGATIVMNSLERNLKLQKQLDERNAQVKKLQGELETKRLYTTNKKRPTSVKSNNAIEVEKVKINMPVKSLTFKGNDARKSNSLTASLEYNHTQCFFASLKLNNFRGHCAYSTNGEKDNENRCPRNSGSPESDLDRNELFCETPHKEIQQLHKYVIDVLSEVDTLKETIAQIQGERKRTENVLNEKQGSVLDLQIKHHKGIKSNKPIQRNNNKVCNNKLFLVYILICSFKESNNKKTAAVIKSPRKIRVKKKSKNERKNDALQILSSCMDAIETQIQRESSGINTESESDYNV